MLTTKKKKKKRKKKQEKTTTDNYREISLFRIVSKVFTAVLNKTKTGRKGSRNSKELAGFDKGYSTTDHIFTLVTVVKKKLNCKRGGKVYVAFIDHKKAFDTAGCEKLR